ncbi:hypothetical protein HanIR_Chr06g0276701 [Helianthus annuus]|nr:hypothetical protein HanIR_Chr06g0276701 [Helianthus annuus]
MHRRIRNAQQKGKKFFSQSIRFRVKRMKDINDIIIRLKDLVEDKATLRSIVKEGTRLKIINGRLQTSKVDVSIFVGREGEEEVLVCRLLGDEPCDRNFSVVPIVGMGGVGKKNSS